MTPKEEAELILPVVSSSTGFDLKSSGMKEYIFELEIFEKTEQRLELDKVLIKSVSQSTGDVILYDYVLTTFEKYMCKYGSTNIKIKTNKLKPQIYKVMAYEIEIVS